MITRPDRDNFPLPKDRHGDLPLPVAKRALERHQYVRVTLKLREPPFKLQLFQHPAQVRYRLMHAWLRDLNNMQSDQRIDRQIVYFGSLANDLSVNLTFRRHIDNRILQQSGGTAKPAPLSETLGFIIGDLIITET